MKEMSLYPEITDEEVVDALTFATRQIRHNLPRFTDKFQSAYSIGNFYHSIENVDWTNGFWTGEIWLAYEFAKEIGKDQMAQKLKDAGLTQVDSFYNRIVNKVKVDHHDMGLLFSPSCVAAYKLTEDLKAKEAAVLAAEQMITRFQEFGNFIQAWGNIGEPQNYKLVIDCFLNLPILYWASEETGDEKYKIIADKHISSACENIIRDDFSTWNMFFFDAKTGEPDHGSSGKGYSDGSAWARGQAWGIYGLAMAYRFTKNEEYIEKFMGVAQFFLEHLPEDLIPFWDLQFTDGDQQSRDSSAASIAVCGMLEMSRYLPEAESKYCISMAKKILKALYDNCSVRDVTMSNGLILHGTYSSCSPYNDCSHFGVDECTIWGDYYYMEALTRVHKDWNQYW